jgi:hypothetical protein
MTIGAGFLYDGGLLLCADTQFTGQIKLQGSKILPYTYNDKSKSAIVTVGHAQYTKMCAQLIQDSVIDLPAASRTISKMHLVLIAAIKSLHQDHFFKHPQRDSLAAQFLIGFWSAQDKQIGFFSTEETAVARMYGYNCLGSGEILAHKYIRPKYKRLTSILQKPRHTYDQVFKMAGDALKDVKAFDPNCGGHTEYLTISDDGEMSPVQKLKLK